MMFVQDRADVARSWCARMQFAGKATFIMGTVVADGHEDARGKLVELALTIFPHETDVVAVIPGAVVFQERVFR